MTTPPAGRILVVDDDPSVLALLEQYLKRSGYSPVTAASGTEALDRARSEEPDLILLDIMLPDISGHDVCERLRNDRQVRQIPIVMMTAHGDRETVVRCLENGADDFIRKPIDLAELRARLRAQGRSLEFRRFYRDFFESFPGALMVVRPDGTVVSGNLAATELLGAGMDTILDQPVVKAVAEEYREVLQQALLMAPESATPVIIPEICFKTQGSGLRSCELQVQPFAKDSTRLVVTAIDRTHRRYLESELYKTRDVLDSIIQSSVDGIIAVNRKGTIVLFNDGAASITGYRPEDVIGRMHISDLYVEDGGRDVMKKLRTPGFGGVGKLETSAYVIVAKDGTQVPVNLSASLLHDSNGQEIGSVGIFQDLRERIRIEQELTAIREKLIESERERAVSELAGAASHELNQPLTAVAGNLQLILGRKDLAPDLRAVLEKLSAETDRMTAVVKQIGRSTRFQTKKYLNNTRIVDLKRQNLPDDPDGPPGSGEAADE